MWQLLIIATRYIRYLNINLFPFQNFRRAFELQSTQKWNQFILENKTTFLKQADNSMDMAKDVAFLTHTNMQNKKKEELTVKSKSQVPKMYTKYHCYIHLYI